MRYLYIFVALASLASCSHRITTTTKTVEKDSVHVDTVRHRKIVKEKGDTAFLEFNFRDVPTGITKSPKSDSIIFKKEIKKGKLTETVTVSKKGQVQIHCKEDSLQRIIDQQTITIQKFKTTTTTTQVTKVEHKATDFDKFCRTFTILFFILLGLLIANKFKKFIPWIP